MKFYRAVFTVLFFNMVIVASAFSIKGHVVDAEGEPEGYATVRIYNVADTVRAAALGITDDGGNFNLPVKSAGDYKVMVSSVGKKPIAVVATLTTSTPDADLGVLVAKDNAAELGEVDVVATKPLVVKEIDRIGYDVQADEDSKTSTVQDVLRKVPMVTVDSDGTVKVKGSTNFKIYKDGRPNNAFTANAKDIFAAIPASMIKKIEVITDPGSKEDAEGVGAILNIVTFENTSMNGIMGNASLSMSTRNATPMPNIWLTGNVGKLALSLYAGYHHQGYNDFKTKAESDYKYTESGNRQHSTTSAKQRGDVAYWGLDGSYELDSLNLFTMEFGGFFHSGKGENGSFTEMLNPLGDVLYSYSTTTRTPRSRYLDFHGSFNYQHQTHRPGEIFTLSYQVSHNNNKSLTESEYGDLFQFPAPYSGINADTRLNFLENTGQIDWTRPYGEHHNVSVGAKVIARKNSSVVDNEYVGVDAVHTDFDHNTTVGAGYFDYRYHVGRLSARGGLRYEYSRLSAKFKDGSNPDFGSSLNDWVPNASVMYNINDASTMKLSYATRINRPGINFLNPAETVTPSSVSSGNPDLESVHYNTLSVNYSLIKQKFNIDATLSYDFANNTITSLTTVDDNDFSTSTFDNIGRSRSVELSLFAQWSITDKTSVMANGGVNYNRLKIPQVSNGRWGANLFFRATQQLPWKLRAEGFLFFDRGRLESVYSYNANTIRSMFHGFSLQRNFLKEDRLTVKVQYINPFAFHGMGWRSVTDRGAYTGWQNTSVQGVRGARLSISYRFGSVRSTVKKAAASIVNDDLQGGSSAPSNGQGQGQMQGM